MKASRSLSPLARLGALAGVALFLLTAVLFLIAPRIFHALHLDADSLSRATLSTRFAERLFVLGWGSFFSMLLLGPALLARSRTPSGDEPHASSCCS